MAHAEDGRGTHEQKVRNREDKRQKDAGRRKSKKSMP